MSDEIGKEALIAQVVALTLQDVPEYKIAEEMKLSRYKVNKLRNSLEFKEQMKEITDSARDAAKAGFLAKIETLAPLAYKALKSNLEDGKLDAVRVFVEVVGLKDADTGPKQDTSITVIMPGADQTKTIEVKPEVPDAEEV